MAGIQCNLDTKDTLTIQHSGWFTQLQIDDSESTWMSVARKHKAHIQPQTSPIVPIMRVPDTAVH